jgi:hypothetical protein
MNYLNLNKIPLSVTPMIGRKFGLWLVLGYSKERRGNCKAALVDVVCDCGTKAAVSASSVREGASSNCGCERKKNLAKVRRTHGQSVGRKATKILRTFWAMHTRCTNPRAASSLLYMAKGIRICEGWTGRRGILNFITQMGPPPSAAHSIDRIKNDLHYSCGKCSECVENLWDMNCRWADRKTQNRNTSRNLFVAVDGVKMCASDAAKILRKSKNTICKIAKESKNTPEFFTK